MSFFQRFLIEFLQRFNQKNQSKKNSLGNLFTNFFKNHFGKSWRNPWRKSRLNSWRHLFSDSNRERISKAFSRDISNQPIFGVFDCSSMEMILYSSLRLPTFRANWSNCPRTMISEHVVFSCRHKNQLEHLKHQNLILRKSFLEHLVVQSNFEQTRVLFYEPTNFIQKRRFYSINQNPILIIRLQRLY